MKIRNHPRILSIALSLTSLVIGVSIGPSVQRMILVIRLRHTTDYQNRVLIADRLARAEEGRRALISLLKVNHNNGYNYSCLFAILSHEKPWDSYSLFGYSRELTDDEYLSLLSFFDYSEEQQTVVNALKYEHLHCGRNPNILSYIESILESFKCVNCDLNSE